MELMETKSKVRIFSVMRSELGAEFGTAFGTASGAACRRPRQRTPAPALQNAPSCVKLKPGKVTPSADLATFTFTTGASGAVTSAGRSPAYCVKTSLYTLVTR